MTWKYWLIGVSLLPVGESDIFDQKIQWNLMNIYNNEQLTCLNLQHLSKVIWTSVFSILCEVSVPAFLIISLSNIANIEKNMFHISNATGLD